MAIGSSTSWPTTTRARPKTRPGEVRDALPASLPDEPEDFAAAIADPDRIVLPGLLLWL
jgi:aromatic-L-amino-acid decarboxylase